MQKIAATISTLAFALFSAAVMASGPPTDSGYTSTDTSTTDTSGSMTDMSTDRTGSVGNDQETNAGTNTRDASTDPAEVNPANSTDAPK